MKYRLTCLTPTLVGDGERLSPIDYMVWKDHVNVLDQWRIFRLLAKGPRLEGYLSQLKKAEKLDFASWGGFAQNYAGRRIPFEHPSSTQYWERTHAEHLFIPTFSTGPSGPYLPGTAIKGAFRTGVIHGRLTARMLTDLAERSASDGRLPRHPANSVEESALGPAGADPLRVISAYDSKTVPATTFKVYLLRTSTLEARGGGKFEVAWKQTPRGNVKWHQNAFLSQPEIGKALRRRASIDAHAMFEFVNAYTERLLKIQRQYAEWSGLALLKSTIEQLEARLIAVREARRGCVLPLGWGAGFLSKTAVLDTQDETYREVLRQVGLYSRAIQSGLPFPKTRRIVFLGNQPASIPGFVHLEVTGAMRTGVEKRNSG
jgi:CRISPR-associated protein Csm5